MMLSFSIPGSHYLQDFEKCKKSGTIGSEIGENKAQLLYDQYTFLNENERLVSTIMLYKNEEYIYFFDE